MFLVLAPTLEVDMVNVTICSGNFYYILVICDVLCRHNEVLGPTTIAVPRPD